MELIGVVVKQRNCEQGRENIADPPSAMSRTSSKRSYVSGGGCRRDTMVVVSWEWHKSRRYLTTWKVVAESSPVEISSCSPMPQKLSELRRRAG